MESDHLSAPTRVVGWELHGQVGCQDYSSQFVERGSSDQNIVKRFGVDKQVSDFDRPTVSISFSKLGVQVNVPSGVDSLPREANDLFIILDNVVIRYTHLSEGFSIQDIHRASLIYQSFHDDKVGYFDGDYHRVIMLRVYVSEV